MGPRDDIVSVRVLVETMYRRMLKQFLSLSTSEIIYTLAYGIVFVIIYHFLFENQLV